MPYRKTFTALLLGLLPAAMLPAAEVSAQHATSANNVADAQTSLIHLLAQPLQRALIEFVSQTGSGVVVADGVNKQIRTRAVHGRLNSRQALQRLLLDTGLQATAKNGYFLIHPQHEQATLPTAVNPPTMEEVVVTGSWTQRRKYPSANNITLIDRPTFASYGSVTAADLVAYLPSVTGTENQTNQFDNNYAAGTSNINLRGLGVSRTLVLLNGRRSVSSALPHNDGQSYVDLNSLPWNALERIELLKDGAAATYGSDAVAGVVNFITRRPQQGLTLNGHFKHIDESEGDWNLGLTWGHLSERGEWLTSLEYLQRNELAVNDRLETTQPRVDLPDTGQVVFGQSSIGNPGFFLPVDSASAANGLSATELAHLARSENQVADPGCAASLGIPLPDNRCGFRYIHYDNLVEKERHLRWFSSVDWQLNATDKFYGELLLSHSEVPQWKTSASYPPLQESDGSYYLPADHPALLDFQQQYPDATTVDERPADFGGGALYIGRAVGGPAARARRESLDYRTGRLLAGWQRQTEHGRLDLSLLHAINRAQAEIPDTLKSRWQQSLLGLGGPDCSGEVAGENDCQYFNPFSSAHPGTPGFVPSLANSTALMSWLQGQSKQTNTMELSTLDALWQGQVSLGQLATEYALGAQLRHEQLDIHFNASARLTGIGPNTDEAPANELIFFAGGENDRLQQSTVAVFGELLLPVSPSLELQAGLRFEDYHGSVGHNLDPKLTLLWQINNHWSLRLSGSTSFRAPSLNQTGQNTTSQDFIGELGVFKATYRIGNPDLDAERAHSFNLGLLHSSESNSGGVLRASADFWAMQLSDPIVQQSANDIVSDVLSNPQSAYTEQVVFDNGQRPSHVIAHYINGPDLNLSGVDLSLLASRPVHRAQISTGLDASYTHQFKVDASDLRPAFDAAGRSNTGTFLQPMPRWKGSIWTKLEWREHQLQLRWNYVDSYKDEGLQILNLDQLPREMVGSYRSWDLFYRYQWPNNGTRLSISINNLMDTEPPDVNDDLRYESSLHNPFGRTASLELRHDL